MNRSLLLQRTVLLIILSAFAIPSLYAQEYPMKHYTTDDGLPSNTVYHVYKDSKGFLWIGTDKGIARYNGIKFEVFTTFNGLPDNEVFFFQEDHYGRLWLSTYNGELCYYKDGVFHTAENTPFLRLPFKSSFIKLIKLEKDNSVTITFYDKSRFVNINYEKSTVVDLRRLTSASITFGAITIEKIAGNKYEIYTNDKAIFIDTAKGIEHIIKFNNQLGDRKSTLMENVFCQNQAYVVSDYFILSRQMKVIRQLDDNFYKNNHIHQVYCNELGMFLATNNGIILNDSTHLLREYETTCITQGKNGNYWVSTLEGGIFLMDKDFLHTRIFINDYAGKIKYTYFDNQRILFVNDKNDLYKIEKGHVSYVNNYNLDSRNGVAYPIASAVKIDSNNSLYNCNYDGVVYVKDVINKPFDIKRYYSTNIPHINVFKSLIVRRDSVFINSSTAILGFDRAKLIKLKKPDYAIIDDTVKKDKIFAMAMAPDESIWYSTVSNVFKVVNGKPVLQPQFRDIAFKAFDFYGNFLVGYTHNNKLLVCDHVENGITIDSVTTQNCIWDKLYRIDKTHLLISTNNLYRLLTLKPGTPGRFSIWPVENQFIPAQAESFSFDGTFCYFFKSSSVTSVRMESLLRTASPPSLIFGLLKAGAKSYEIRSVLPIPYKESRNISIAFLPCSFGSEKVICQYSVSKNGQDVWRRVKGDEINLINSGYGDYMIKIRARTASSDYSAPIMFTLRVMRPFWAKWWFITLMAGIVIAITAFFIRRRILVALRKKEMQHISEVKFLKSEYKALNALMNPHFIFNTLNNVQSLYNNNDKLAANEYMRVFADLIRQNMHNVSKELITLEKEIGLVNNYLLLEKLRFDDQLNYHINVDENIDLSDIVVPPLLLQPLVENSIKHGILPMLSGEGFIQINVYEQDAVLYIEVKDNGVGVSPSKSILNPEHQSFGMSNIRQRIEQLSVILNKKITFNIRIVKDDKDDQQWTVVTISMPIL